MQGFLGQFCWKKAILVGGYDSQGKTTSESLHMLKKAQQANKLIRIIHDALFCLNNFRKTYLRIICAIFLFDSSPKFVNFHSRVIVSFAPEFSCCCWCTRESACTYLHATLNPCPCRSVNFAFVSPGQTIAPDNHHHNPPLPVWALWLGIPTRNVWLIKSNPPHTHWPPLFTPKGVRGKTENNAQLQTGKQYRSHHLRLLG